MGNTWAPVDGTVPCFLQEVSGNLLELISACLAVDPHRRPTVHQLLTLPYFWGIPRLLAGSDLVRQLPYAAQYDTAGAAAAAAAPYPWRVVPAYGAAQHDGAGWGMYVRGTATAGRQQGYQHVQQQQQQQQHATGNGSWAAEGAMLNPCLAAAQPSNSCTEAPPAPAPLLRSAQGGQHEGSTGNTQAAASGAAWAAPEPNLRDMLMADCDPAAGVGAEQQRPGLCGAAEGTCARGPTPAAPPAGVVAPGCQHCVGNVPAHVAAQPNVGAATTAADMQDGALPTSSVAGDTAESPDGPVTPDPLAPCVPAPSRTPAQAGSGQVSPLAAVTDPECAHKAKAGRVPSIAKALTCPGLTAGGGGGGVRDSSGGGRADLQHVFAPSVCADAGNQKQREGQGREGQGREGQGQAGLLCATGPRGYTCQGVPADRPGTVDAAPATATSTAAMTACGAAAGGGANASASTLATEYASRVLGARAEAGAVHHTTRRLAVRRPTCPAELMADGPQLDALLQPVAACFPAHPLPCAGGSLSFATQPEGMLPLPPAYSRLGLSGSLVGTHMDRGQGGPAYFAAGAYAWGTHAAAPLNALRRGVTVGGASLGCSCGSEHPTAGCCNGYSKACSSVTSASQQTPGWSGPGAWAALGSVNRTRPPSSCIQSGDLPFILSPSGAPAAPPGGNMPSCWGGNGGGRHRSNLTVAAEGTAESSPLVAVGAFCMAGSPYVQLPYQSAGTSGNVEASSFVLMDPAASSAQGTRGVADAQSGPAALRAYAKTMRWLSVQQQQQQQQYGEPAQGRLLHAGPSGMLRAPEVRTHAYSNDQAATYGALHSHENHHPHAGPLLQPPDQQRHPQQLAIRQGSSTDAQPLGCTYRSSGSNRALQVYRRHTTLGAPDGPAYGAYGASGAAAYPPGGLMLGAGAASHTSTLRRPPGRSHTFAAPRVALAQGPRRLSTAALSTAASLPGPGAAGHSCGVDLGCPLSPPALQTSHPSRMPVFAGVSPKPQATTLTSPTWGLPQHSPILNTSHSSFRAGVVGSLGRSRLSFVNQPAASSGMPDDSLPFDQSALPSRAASTAGSVTAFWTASAGHGTFDDMVLPTADAPGSTARLCSTSQAAQQQAPPAPQAQQPPQQQQHQMVSGSAVDRYMERHRATPSGPRQHAFITHMAAGGVAPPIMELDEMSASAYAAETGPSPDGPSAPPTSNDEGPGGVACTVAAQRRLAMLGQAYVGGHGVAGSGVGRGGDGGMTGCMSSGPLGAGGCAGRKQGGSRRGAATRDAAGPAIGVGPCCGRGGPSASAGDGSEGKGLAHRIKETLSKLTRRPGCLFGPQQKGVSG